MTPAEYVRATAALTALQQCGDGMARAVQDFITHLTMAEAVMTRTRTWLAEAEPPSALEDDPPVSELSPEGRQRGAKP